MSRILISGFGFAGYRSYYAEPVFIGPLASVNVIAGQNNSGKSNILRFAQDVLTQLQGRRGTSIRKLPKLEVLDRPIGVPGETPLRLLLPIRSDVETLAKGSAAAYTKQAYERLLHLNAMRAPGSTENAIQLTGGPSGQADEPLTVADNQVDACIAEWPDWDHDYMRVFNNVLGGSGAVDSRQIMSRMIQNLIGDFQVPPVHTIVASRRIEAEDANPDGRAATRSGAGIIQRLAEIQNPTAHRWDEATRQFSAVNRFAQTVLGDENVQLHIPHDQSTILVSDGLRTLPLENLGTGLQQVIILAAHATTIVKSLICIEEPETHLHPVLQRKLIEYLAAETSNQYLIATHSAHMLNYEAATVLAVSLGDQGSRIPAVKKPYQLSLLCADLGYRPADLVQSNAVIWVEGPSDRTYINAWLKLLSPDLKEQIHYSVMFYGGKLLSHLSVDQNALQDFIDLRLLNRNSVVIIDSDRSSEASSISATKQRILDEFASEPEATGFAWVTSCYTIENYVPRGVLADAVKSVHGDRRLTGTDYRWHNPLKTPKEGPSFDKIAIARAVVKDLKQEDLDNYGLRDRVGGLVAFIRAANGIDN